MTAAASSSSTKVSFTADSHDTDEKRTIGVLWEKVSGEEGLFLIVEKDVGGKNMRAQMASKMTDP